MNPHKGLHLEEDHIITAVVDETDLTQNQREHLLICDRCREKKERIEEDLARLGRMAERYAPSPKRAVFLSAEKPKRSFLWSWQWRTGLGVAVAALFIAIAGIQTLFRNAPGLKNQPYTQEILESEVFMAEVNMLSENVLPQEYLDMAGEADEEMDEGFMDFMVPTIEDEFSFQNSKRNGGELC